MKRLIKKLWFPATLIVAVAVVFFAFGPPAQRPSSETSSAIAPSGAGDSPASAAPAGASATEREIATIYETIREAPDTIDAYVLLGNAYLQHVREKGDPQDYARAEAAFNEALAREADNHDALIGLGAVALARHQFADALELGNRAVALAPTTARARGVVVDALTELGRYDEAVAAAQEMVDLRPDLASLSRVAYQRELRGDIDGAIDAMARAFDAATGSPPENREYLRVLIGDLHLLKGDDETAQQIYEASLETLPDFVWANAGLGRAAVARGDFAAAADYYQRATDVLPLPDMLVALGDAQAAAGQTAEAEDTYELVRSIQSLFEANGVNADLELALFEANHGDPARAVELATAAYGAQPNVKAADALAWSLQRAGRSEEAAPYAAEALRLGSVYPNFLFHAGVIAQASGDDAAARSHFERAEAAPGALSPLDAITARNALATLAVAE